MAGNNILPFRRRRVAGKRKRPSEIWLRAYRQFCVESIDRLAGYIRILKEKEMADLQITAPEGEAVIYMTRTLKAPRALVWKALSEPEHVVRWWGPHGHSNRVIEFDWRVGGRWQIETTTGDGEIINFFGHYREIVQPETVTQTFAFDQLPEGMFSVDTVVLEDHGDTTVYRATSTLPDLASRDGMLASGMETGVVEGFERLDLMLEEFKANA